MKKLFSLFAIPAVAAVFVGSTAFRPGDPPATTKPAVEQVKWYTLEEAQRLSDSVPRKIFVDFTTSWCGWCKVMDANTFSHPIIAKYMNANFYCVRFDAETHDTVTFNGQKYFNRGAVNTRSAHDFAVTVLQGRLSYPSFVFIGKDRLTFTIMQGYMPPEQFEPYLHYYAEDKEKTMTFQDYQKIFKSEIPKPRQPDGPPQN